MLSQLRSSARGTSNQSSFSQRRVCYLGHVLWRPADDITKVSYQLDSSSEDWRQTRGKQTTPLLEGPPADQPGTGGCSNSLPWPWELKEQGGPQRFYDMRFSRSVRINHVIFFNIIVYQLVRRRFVRTLASRPWQPGSNVTIVDMSVGRLRNNIRVRRRSIPVSLFRYIWNLYPWETDALRVMFCKGKFPKPSMRMVSQIKPVAAEFLFYGQSSMSSIFEFPQDQTSTSKTQHPTFVSTCKRI